MATCPVQWWTVQKGGDPRTDHAIKGTASQLPLMTQRYSRTSVGIAPRRRDPKTPVREGEGTREPWRRDATGCCRLSRQLLVCGQGLQRGETMDNDFALAEATACRAARTNFHIPRW